MPSDHVGHYMVKPLDAMYPAREKVHVADVRAKVSLAKRSPPSTNCKVELVIGDTVFYFESLEKGKDFRMGRLWSLVLAVTLSCYGTAGV